MDNDKDLSLDELQRLATLPASRMRAHGSGARPQRVVPGGQARISPTIKVGERRLRVPTARLAALLGAED